MKTSKLTKTQKKQLVKDTKKAGRDAGRSQSDILKDADRKATKPKKHGEKRPTKTDVRVKSGNHTFLI